MVGWLVAWLADRFGKLASWLSWLAMCLAGWLAFFGFCEPSKALENFGKRGVVVFWVLVGWLRGGFARKMSENKNIYSTHKNS